MTYADWREQMLAAIATLEASAERLSACVAHMPTEQRRMASILTRMNLASIADTVRREAGYVRIQLKQFDALHDWPAS